jgi:hypothetical protein
MHDSRPPCVRKMDARDVLVVLGDARLVGSVASENTSELHTIE